MLNGIEKTIKYAKHLRVFSKISTKVLTKRILKLGLVTGNSKRYTA